jgi:hypothetical protein
MNTFNDKVGRNIYKIVHKYIKSLYKMKQIYTIKEIIDYIKEYINMDDKIIYLSLEDMIERKITIYHNNIQGYIIYNNNYYLFQPSNSNDETMSIYDRTNIKPIRRNYINLTIKKKATQVASPIKVINESQINNINDIKLKIKKQITEIDNIVKEINKKKLDINNYKWMLDESSFKYELTIDRLSIDDRSVLVKYILTKDTLDDFDKIVKQYYQRNFIYKINGEFKIDEMYDTKPIGFVLFNKISPIAYIINGDKLEKSSSILERLYGYLSVYRKSKKYKTRYGTYADIWSFNDSGKLKIITETSKDPVKTSYRGKEYIKYGKECLPSSQEHSKSYDDLVKLIDMIDKSDINRIRQDIVDKKFTRKYMCILFELICRKYTTDDLIYHLKEDSLFMKIDILNLILKKTI